MGRFGTLAAALLLTAAALGCASSGDVNSVRSDAAEAKRLAQEANAKATLAAADAAAARTASEAAAKDAQEAKEKSDRIFQRSLKK
jgi:hypothetical protein